MKVDWRKIFTEAFRGKEVSKELDKLFDEGYITLTREQFEEITVKVTSTILEEVIENEIE